jgi:leucyl aminopeptidase (aminopeptidase T)
LIIVYDSKKSYLAKKFKNISSNILDDVTLLKVPVAKVNGEEPPKKVEKDLLKHDVAIFLTSKSLSHTKTRRKATEKGIRIASMPGITETILKRSIDINYKEIKDKSTALSLLMNYAKKARIKTSLGTDIEFSLKGRKTHGLSAGIYNKKGEWGNLPEGEVFIAPVEGTAKGHFVVDGSIAGFGKINHPLVFFVEEGYVTKITDGKNPPKIEKLLNKLGKKARNIAEFGIGLNKKAKVTGIVLEDEKAYGTCHIALGNNIGFGGKTDVPLHIDCVIKKPSIYLDDKIVVKKGTILL